MKPSQPNFLIIMCDQWRGDALGIEGHPVVHTPNVDALAASGVRFTHAYSTCPACIPARRSFMSGQFPSSHGLLGNREGVAWNPPTTLPGELRKTGYHTALVGRDMHQHPRRKRFGFDEMVHCGDVHPDDLYDGRLPGHGYNPSWSHGLHSNGWTARPWHMEDNLHPSCRTVDAALRFLERRDPECPFFLVASFAAPHPPLYPPAFYMDRYLRKESHQPHIGNWAKQPKDSGIGLPIDSPYACLEGEALASCQAGYYGLINHIDDQICRLLSFPSGISPEDLANTIIIFCSDHGEMLGDHYMFRKSRPYEGSARVPLVFHAPERFGFQRGGTPETAVSLEDLMPTVLELAGVEVPDSVDGTSLVPLLRGDGIARKTIHAEHGKFLGQSWHMLTDGRMKYIWHCEKGEEQLFDLDADPNELNDLTGSASHQQCLKEWRGKLIERLQDRPEGFTDGQQLIPGRAHALVMKQAGTVP